MSQSQATRPVRRARPLSPHLTVYRWPITMTMSILHRISGGALYFGMLLIAWWLMAAATSRQQFDFVNATFAAQKAWRAAAAYRDLALELAPGTSELEKGTRKEGAEACPSSKR